MMVNFERFDNPTNGDQKRWKELRSHLEKTHEVKTFISTERTQLENPLNNEERNLIIEKINNLHSDDMQNNTSFTFDHQLTLNLENYFCPISVIPNFKKEVDEFKPDYIYFNYPFFRRLFDYVPNYAKTIVDLPISFYQKNVCNAKYNFLKDPGLSLEQEINMLKRADILTFSHPEEMKLFDNPKLTQRKVFFFTALPETLELKWPNKPTVTFVSGGSEINKAYFKSFFENCWNKIKQEVPEANLMVVGGCESMLTSHPDFTKITHSDDLGKIYQDSTCIINPVRIGAGMKMKVCEAIASKKPLITFPDHLENVFTNNLALIARDWDIFSKAVVHALKNHTKFDEMRSEQHHFWKQWLSEDNCYSKLDKELV